MCKIIQWKKNKTNNFTGSFQCWPITSLHIFPPLTCAFVCMCVWASVCLILPAKRFNSLGMALKGRRAVDSMHMNPHPHQERAVERMRGGKRVCFSLLHVIYSAPFLRKVSRLHLHVVCLQRHASVHILKIVTHRQLPFFLFFWYLFFFLWKIPASCVWREVACGKQCSDTAQERKLHGGW